MIMMVCISRSYIKSLTKLNSPRWSPMIQSLRSDWQERETLRGTCMVEPATSGHH